jgi:hypothetical protein
MKLTIQMQHLHRQPPFQGQELISLHSLRQSLQPRSALFHGYERVINLINSAIYEV